MAYFKARRFQVKIWGFSLKIKASKRYSSIRIPSQHLTTRTGWAFFRADCLQVTPAGHTQLSAWPWRSFWLCHLRVSGIKSPNANWTVSTSKTGALKLGEQVQGERLGAARHNGGNVSEEPDRTCEFIGTWSLSNQGRQWVKAFGN